MKIIVFLSVIRILEDASTFLTFLLYFSLNLWIPSLSFENIVCVPWAGPHPSPGYSKIFYYIILPENNFWQKSITIQRYRYIQMYFIAKYNFNIEIYVSECGHT